MQRMIPVTEPSIQQCQHYQTGRLIFSACKSGFESSIAVSDIVLRLYLVIYLTTCFFVFMVWCTVRRCLKMFYFRIQVTFYFLWYGVHCETVSQNVNV